MRVIQLPKIRRRRDDSQLPPPRPDIGKNGTSRSRAADARDGAFAPAPASAGTTTTTTAAETPLPIGLQYFERFGRAAFFVKDDGDDDDDHDKYEYESDSLLLSSAWDPTTISSSSSSSKLSDDSVFDASADSQNDGPVLVDDHAAYGEDRDDEEFASLFLWNDDATEDNSSRRSSSSSSSSSSEMSSDRNNNPQRDVLLQFMHEGQEQFDTDYNDTILQPHPPTRAEEQRFSPSSKTKKKTKPKQSKQQSQSQQQEEDAPRGRRILERFRRAVLDGKRTLQDYRLARAMYETAVKYDYAWERYDTNGGDVADDGGDADRAPGERTGAERATSTSAPRTPNIDREAMKQFFHLSLKHSTPFQAYEVLKQYQSIFPPPPPPTPSQSQQSQSGSESTYATEHNIGDGDHDHHHSLEEDHRIDMYERLCNRLRDVSPATHAIDDIQRLVRSILVDMNKNLSTQGKVKCYPTLLSSLLDQRSNKIGSDFATIVYQEMKKIDQDILSPHSTNTESSEANYTTGERMGQQQDMEPSPKICFTPGFLQHLVSLSKYNRRDDLPFAEILDEVVFRYGCKPLPVVAIGVLEHQYPYVNTSTAPHGTKHTTKKHDSDPNDRIGSQYDPQRRKGSIDRQRNTEIALRAIIHLHREQQRLRQEELEEEFHQQQWSPRTRNPKHHYKYIIDVATLEAISAAAANTGNVALNMLVWEAYDCMGYYSKQPTNQRIIPASCLRGNSSSTTTTPGEEVVHNASSSSTGGTMIQDGDLTTTLLENTALTFFANGPDTYANGFQVLAELEARRRGTSNGGPEGNDYANDSPINRALVRSVSLHLRKTSRNHEIAFRQLKNLCLENEISVSTGMLNCILSAAAERGDINWVVSILDEFPENDLKPDADSFSYAIEALGKHLLRRSKYSVSTELQSSCLDQATAFIEMMESYGIAPTQHLIRDYVELLVLAGEVETATQVVLDEYQNSSSPAVDESNRLSRPPLVNSKAIYCVAVANAKLGNFDVAREVASCISPATNVAGMQDTTAYPYILESIQRLEDEQQAS